MSNGKDIDSNHVCQFSAQLSWIRCRLPLCPGSYGTNQILDDVMINRSDWWWRNDLPFVGEMHWFTHSYYVTDQILGDVMMNQSDWYISLLFTLVQPSMKVACGVQSSVKVVNWWRNRRCATVPPTSSSINRRLNRWRHCHCSGTDQEPIRNLFVWRRSPGSLLLLFPVFFAKLTSVGCDIS